MVACLKFTIHSAPETNKLGANIYLAPFMGLHRSLTHYTGIHTDIYTYVYYIYIHICTIYEFSSFWVYEDHTYVCICTVTESVTTKRYDLS